MLGFLFVDEEDFKIEGEAAERILTPDAAPALEASITAIKSAGDWTSQAIEACFARRAGGRFGPQAEGRLRAGAGRGDRAAGITATVRVDRASGQGTNTQPAQPRPRLDRRAEVAVARAAVPVDVFGDHFGPPVPVRLNCTGASGGSPPWGMG